ncbi:alpha/beta hydrolase [Microbacterium sp. NPDC077184]|uniref:alpha/beta hydrolase n=1 Tax=Microbacterium sp. NPDC077184 TaxID=3154764 RepID=UPI00344A268F
MTLISLEAVPELPADPEALASAASEMTAAAQLLASVADTLGAEWGNLPVVYDTPETGSLASTLHPVRNAAQDTVDTVRTMAGALDDLASTLASAKYRLEQLRPEVPLLRARAAEHQRELEELYDIPVEADALPSHLSLWNDRLCSEAVTIRALIEDARDRCERRLRAIGDAPAVPRVTSTLTDRAPVIEARTQEAFTTAVGMAILRQLSGSDGAAAARLLAVNPDWLLLLQDYPPPPDEVNRWWVGLVPAAASALVAAAPRLVGNLEGVRYADRDRANRLSLASDLSRAEDALAAAEAATTSAAVLLGGPGAAQAAAERVSDARAQLDALRNIKAALGVRANGAPVTLVSLTSDSPPLAAVAIGDLDTADNATYLVPGMGTTTAGMHAWTTSARNLHSTQEKVQPGVTHAVVAWVGYETPPVPGEQGGFDVLQNELAEAGGTRLNSALNGFGATRATTAPALNVVAHSYGTTTAAFALQESGTRVDTFVSVGSAGLPESVAHASDLRAETVYAGQARNTLPFVEPGQGDSWAWVGRTGEHPVNPVSADFGATTFGVDGTDGLLPVTDHATSVPSEDGAGYLDLGTESLRNIARATSGQEQTLTPHSPKGPTALQEALLRGLVRESTHAR